MKKWELQKSDLVYENDWLAIRNNTFLFPDGKIRDEFYTIEKRDFVIMLAEDDAERVLTIKTYRWGVDEILLELPAGIIDDGETPDQAALREFKEETGYTFTTTERHIIYPLPSASNMKGHLYFGSIDATEEPKPAPTEDEFLETDWLTKAELYEKLMTDEIKAASEFAAISLYFLKNPIN